VKVGQHDQIEMTSSLMLVRPARPDDIDQLSRLWHEGWREGHASLVPAELTRLRTLDSFGQRLAAAIGDVRVIGSSGFCWLKGSEVYQPFVSDRERRG
jgi:hypothetical protein